MRRAGQTLKQEQQAAGLQDKIGAYHGDGICGLISFAAVSVDGRSLAQTGVLDDESEPGIDFGQLFHLRRRAVSAAAGHHYHLAQRVRLDLLAQQGAQ